MRMHILKLSLLALIALDAQPAPSRACLERMCRCVSAADQHITDAELVRARRERSERVVLGRVTGIDTLAAERMLGPGDDTVAIRQIVARVHVERVWRGPRTDTLTVRFHTVEWPSSCDLPLEKNGRYVIFAYRLERRWLVTTQCSGTIEARAASATLAALGEGRATRP